MANNLENNFSQDAGDDPKTYWDAIRKRKHDHSFPLVAEWITKTNKMISVSWTRKRKRRRKLAWVSICCLLILFIVSCTYHVERVEKSGSLVNFGIDKRERQSFQKLSLLQQSFAFTPYEFLLPDKPGITSFIFFISGKEHKKLVSITRELKLLRGLRQLDISPVNYNIKESLFSTFLHRALKMGKHEKLKGKDLAQHIQAELDKKGLGFLSTNVVNDNDEKPSFIPTNQTLFTSKSFPGSDTSNRMTNGLPANREKLQRNTRSQAHAENEKLQMFNWLLGTWKVRYVPHPMYHHWMRMNDTSLVCFIIKYEDDEPEISVGFSLAYSAVDSAILSLRGIQWKFLSADNIEINFKNETTPKSANVKWSVDNEKKTWQSVISGEQNLEIVNLVRSDNSKIGNIVNEFIKKNPRKITL